MAAQLVQVCSAHLWVQLPYAHAYTDPLACIRKTIYTMHQPVYVCMFVRELGVWEGASVGSDVGLDVGSRVVGSSVWGIVGGVEGKRVGTDVGVTVGTAEGWREGGDVGR